MEAARSTEEILLGLPRPIAIVGNADVPHAFGSRIDAYPSVIRINNYRTAGFETRVGSKTSCRCVTGWHDVEHRNQTVELTPFTATAPESANLARYDQGNRQPVATASIDVHASIPEVPNPSVGFATVQLCELLGIPVHLYGFDGFRSAHYWDPAAPVRTTHSHREIDLILARSNALLYNELFDYRTVYDHCHREHEGYDRNVGLDVIRRLELEASGIRVLEFGAGNGQLAAHLESAGNALTAIEVSPVAFERIRCADKHLGGALTMALLEGEWDLFLSIDVLEHLTANDARLVIHEAARLCREILVTVSCRPSGLLGPEGENLHLTVQPPAWWEELIAPHFDVAVYEGFYDRQYILMGTRRSAGAEVEDATAAPRACVSRRSASGGQRS